MLEPVNILMVDDDPRNLDVLESLLDRPDYHLIRALNAEEALLALMNYEFAVILLDIRMPEVDGLELAQIIKQRKKMQRLPIIFLTAYYREDEHILQGYGAGAVDYLSKPVNPSILRSKVEVFVDLFRKTQALEIEINERKQAEERVQELNDQLAQRVIDLAEANQELESFSYSVSHDLRAPLRQVSGFVGLLGRALGESLQPPVSEYISLINDSAIRMSQLIDDLLAFSRFGRVELSQQTVDLHELIDRAVHTSQLTLSERDIEWQISPLPEVKGDPAMLYQVIVNLIDNAIKFTRPRAKAVVEVGYKIEGEECVLFVKDNGVGFESHMKEKLFGVFQRLHTASEFEGTGIGLANVRRIIQRHGGRTWAESSIGEGATMYFSLPSQSIVTPAKELSAQA